MKWIQMGKRQTLYHFLMLFFSIFPVNKRLIVISNYYGKGFGDSGKYIAQELLRRNKRYKIVWLSDDNTGMPNGIQTVSYRSIKFLFYLATAAVWIDNCRKSVYTRKRAGQLYIQTWHGPISFKYCEKDAEDYLSKEYVNNCKHDSSLIDVFLSGSRWNTEWIRKAFWYSGNILESGIPRNDVFFKDNSSQIESVKDEFHCRNKKVVLYAPTFRNSKDNNAYDLDFHKLKQTFENHYGEEVAIWVRFHPNVSNLQFLNEEAINVTTYPDMTELLLSADVLLTDFSSSAFDFMLMNKPCFLIAKDYESYIRNERGMYFSKEELPFSFSRNEKELTNAISEFDLTAYLESVESFKNRLGVIEDGTASEKVVDLIINHLSNRR